MLLRIGLTGFPTLASGMELRLIEGGRNAEVIGEAARARSPGTLRLKACW